MKHDFPAIRAAALQLAQREGLSASYKRDLLHIALDCQAAMDGCPASAESVAEFVADDICVALAANAQRDMAKAQLADLERPVGTIALDIDFYSKAEAGKPVEDYDFHAHGHHYQGFGARWCVVKVRWDGSEWKRIRRLSGPLQFTPALERLSEECRRTELERRP